MMGMGSDAIAHLATLSVFVHIDQNYQPLNSQLMGHHPGSDYRCKHYKMESHPVCTLDSQHDLENESNLLEAEIKNHFARDLYGD